MLTFNSGTSYRNLSLLGVKPCSDSESTSIDNIYSNSETLSNHISENVLKALREQLDSQGLNIHTEVEKQGDRTT